MVDDVDEGPIFRIIELRVVGLDTNVGFVFDADEVVRVVSAETPS
jgi:hypothetical protein